MLWLDYLSIKQISNLFSCFLLSFKSFSLHSHSYLTSFLSTHSLSSSLFFTFTSFSSTSFYSHSIIPNQNTPISITIHNNHSSINSINLSISLFHSSFSTISIITELLFVKEMNPFVDHNSPSIQYPSHHTQLFDMIKHNHSSQYHSLFYRYHSSFHSSTYQSFIIFTHSSSVVCLR